jgi:hypothetical protein
MLSPGAEGSHSISLGRNTCPDRHPPPSTRSAGPINADLYIFAELLRSKFASSPVHLQTRPRTPPIPNHHHLPLSNHAFPFHSLLRRTPPRRSRRALGLQVDLVKNPDLRSHMPFMRQKLATVALVVRLMLCAHPLRPLLLSCHQQRYAAAGTACS